MCKLTTSSPSECTAALRQALRFAFSEEGRAAAIKEIWAQHDLVYEAAPHNLGLIMQVAPDGTRTLGRLIKRKFIAEE